MNYEEKYKEALERAKKFEEKYGGDYAGYIFPELAESEDERIRKELVAFFKEMRDTWHEIYWHDLQVEGILTYLEKQKENPKSSDSIPPDCTSDVKCEDRWHKVTDSLPDNGRLVLAKDCLGNVLLARYDGENWEVNVYDNEDHYCHNSISKWCEIPSEKQKEQKPAEWSDEDERYLNRVINLWVNDFGEDSDTVKWLKSLKPSWKPSKEQMKALQNAVALTACDKELARLYNQLQKL